MDNLTVIVPYFNGERWIGRLLDSLPPGLPVIVVDDQSDERLTLNRPQVTVYRPPTKRYFTGAVNFGIEQCRTDVLVLNQDAWLEGTAWLDLIADNRGEYALIGERIRGNHPAFPNGYVQGTFQYMRRDAIEAAGLMNETHYPLWGASALWQWQITRRGFKSLPVLPVPGFHHAEDRKEPHGDSIMELLKRFPDRKPQLIRTPPAISVVVPAFNHGRFLPDLLHSLIGGSTSLGHHPGQTFQGFEVVVVDDGSTDNTAEVMQDYADGWRGIRYIRQDNAGTGAANNTGVKAALGKYVTITGADDMREVWSLADLYEAAEANPHSFVYDEPIVLSHGKRNGRYKLDAYDFEMLLLKNMVPAGIMYPKRAWAEAGGYPTRGLIRRGREDWAFNIALGIKGWCGVKIDRPGYLYRRHENNRTNTNTDTEWLQRFLAQMADLYPGIYRGDRPMGCCGGGKRTPQATTQKAMSAMSRSGAPIEGMALIEYAGRNKGSSQWGGPGGSPSGQKYIFGDNARDKIKYVKASDVAWILGLRDEGRPLFQVRNPKPLEAPKPVEPEPADDTGGQPSGDAPEFGVQSSEGGGKATEGEKLPNDASTSDDPATEPEPADIDPNQLTIAEIKALDLTGDEWRAMYEAEKAGKNRAGAIEFLDAQANDY